MLQNYLLELDGRAAGRFSGFSGGTVQGEVVTTTIGTNQKKHISSVRYQDMEVTCGTGMSRGFYDWLGKGFSGAPERRNGAVIALNNKQAPEARVEFVEAFVISAALPALDASANKQAFMKVRIRPEMTIPKQSATSAKLGVYASASAKAWNIANFRFRIDGLEKESARITQISSISFTQDVKEDTYGSDKQSTLNAGKLDFSNLSVRIPEMHAGGFFDWHQALVVRGQTDLEKTGTLEFFAPNSSKAYFSIDFVGLGVFSTSATSAFRGKTALPVTFELYCESMKFYAGPAAIM